MSDKTALSLEDQALVRKYMLKLVAIPAVILVIVSFVLGFFVNELATGYAYQDAYNRAFSDAIKSIRDTAVDAAKAEVEAKRAKDSALQVKRELDRISKRVKSSDLLTSTERQIAEIALNLLGQPEFIEQVNSMREFKEVDRDANRKRVEVYGGGKWGSWREPSFCPPNHYVCGLSQKVENSQGKGDDTALNSVALECCPLFDE